MAGQGEARQSERVEGQTSRGRTRRGVRMRTKVFAAVVVGGSAIAAGAPGVAATGNSPHTPAVTVIANHLNNPRGLAFDQNGNLWVAEAGRGGTECLPTPGAPTNPTCFGTTGSLSKIRGDGTVSRVFTGLASNASPDGSGATGPDGLSILKGNIYTVITASDFVVPQGLSPNLTVRLLAQSGRLLRGDLNDSSDGLVTVADPGDFDFAWSNQHKSLNPQYPDANPYGVLARTNLVYVVDAAANTLDSIDRHGNIQILAVFPNPPVSDAVPTCVAQGRDGALYIGELTGAGNGPGSADVFKFTPGGGLTVWQTGFSAITGCGFGSDGSFYVTEFDTVGFPPSGPPGGDVVRIAPNGTRTVLGAGQLFFPNGFAAGNDGEIYVSNWSILPGSTSHGGPTGQVVRIG
jgi:hypothetical protein